MPIVSLTKVQLGKETTFQTAVPATYILPVSADPTYSTEFNSVRDSARRGLAAMDFNLLRGGGSTSMSFDGPALPIGIGHLLYGVFGSVSTGVAVSGVYPHTFSLGSSVPSYTIEDANPIAYREYPGSKCSEVKLSFAAADGLLQASSSWVGSIGVSGGSATTGLTAEIAQPWVGIDATVSLAGTPVARVTNFELTIGRAQELVHTTGSRDPSRIDEQQLEVTMSLTLDTGTGSADDLAKYIASTATYTQEAVVLAVTYGSTTTLRALTFTATTMSWGDGPATRDLGSGLYAIALQGRALYNTTDSGPCKIVVNNTQATY